MKSVVHWREALMEALGLGLFMLSAGVFGTLLEAEGSQVRAALPDPLLRRAIMGVAMGGTAVALIYSPWGRRSGAHINPAVTLTFLRLGRVSGKDAVAYVTAQFVGALAGVAIAAVTLRKAFVAPPVGAVATVPGSGGPGIAWLAEATISFALMSVVLVLGRSGRWSRHTGVIVGVIVALYITIEAPLSGMSMNPARTFASAASAGRFEFLWIYFTAPLIGMLLAAEREKRGRARGCAKLIHTRPCVFCDVTADSDARTHAGGKQ